MKSKENVLKEIYLTLQDKKILEHQKQDLEYRIMLKLNSLGLKGSNYSDVVIQMSGVRDKFSEAFSKVSELIERRNNIVKEINAIDKLISYINEKMRNASDLEYRVFSGRVLEGLSLTEISKRENYTIDRIKQVSAEVSKKIACQ